MDSAIDNKFSKSIIENIKVELVITGPHLPTKQPFFEGLFCFMIDSGPVPVVICSKTSPLVSEIAGANPAGSTKKSQQNWDFLAKVRVASQEKTLQRLRLPKQGPKEAKSNQTQIRQQNLCVWLLSKLQQACLLLKAKRQVE